MLGVPISWINRLHGDITVAGAGAAAGDDYIYGIIGQELGQPVTDDVGTVADDAAGRYPVAAVLKGFDNKPARFVIRLRSAVGDG